MGTLEDVRAFFERATFAGSGSMGIAIDKADEEHAVVSVKADERHMNALGFVHGGVLFTLADVTSAAMIRARGGTAVTMSSDMHFTHPAKRGQTVTAVARARHDGMRICVFDVEITADGTPCAFATMTFHKIHGKKSEEDR